MGSRGEGSARQGVADTHKALAVESAKRWATQKVIIERFISTFTSTTDSPDYKYGTKKYMTLLQRVANKYSATVFVELEDVDQFCQRSKYEEYELKAGDDEFDTCRRALVSDIENNTFRFQKFFIEACEAVMPEKDEQFNEDKSCFAADAVRRWRERMIASQVQAGINQEEVQASMPAQLHNMFDVRFVPRANSAVPLREIKVEKVGGLVTLDCLVARVSPVKPKVSIVTYTCEACSAEVFQTVEGDNYSPLLQCPGERCKTNKAAGKMRMNIRTSIFKKFQEIRVQEMSKHVPIGGVPMSITVQCQDDLCRKILPGDPITLSGVYTPSVLPWFLARKQGTNQTMYIDCHSIVKMKQQYNEVTSNTATIEERLNEESRSGQIYERAAVSIAPEIFGMVDVKKALLMALIGSYTKTTEDGMKIRGDIHTLLMGDPGMAKSQLLKQVCNIAPRSVYTTGKGSTGVGLTAAVVRDPVTGEVSLEGGALVLADKGVCCIDEFDKMDESDRTAIHEVMEQQTVSIAKAGITVTLNTRTTVLAGANPQFGRYNPHKSPVENIDLPPALLSRFDLLFLLLDTVNSEYDRNLALHVCKVHCAAKEKGESAPSKQKLGDGAGGDGGDDNDDDALGLGFRSYDAEFMRAYIRRARDLEPLVGKDLQQLFVDAYVTLRDEERRASTDSRKSYTTPRQLLAIVRLSQAHARARLSTQVERSDFEEAMRLIQASKESVEVAPKKDAAAIDVVYDILADLSKRPEVKDGWVEISLVNGMATHKGLNEEQVKTAIEGWESLSVLTKSPDNKMVCFAVPT